MVYRIMPFILLLLVSCSATNFYVVRHAEKESANNMTSDVPLSEEGAERARALKDVLKSKNIQAIYSTNTKRTIATAQPLSEEINVPIQTYAANDSLFVSQLLQTKKGNVLIVGHSNTVDDLVNGLAGRKMIEDLPDDQYGNLFIVHKRNKHTTFRISHFGKRKIGKKAGE